MDIKNFNFGKFVEDVQNEITMVSATIKERGTNRFTRPIIIAVAMVFGSYHFVYQAPQAKISGMQRRIDAARATAQYADQYKEVRDALNAVTAKLPSGKDREHWLTDTIIETLKAEGLISDSIVPPEEQTVHAYSVQRVSVALTAKFSELYSLIHRIETVRPALHVMSIELTKTDKLELNTISIGVGTMIPPKKVP